jgi:para-aminobenzoate N-oxygenase AurF
MTTTTVPLPLAPMPRTAARSRQLVAASERTTLDPFREIDWSVPIDDSAFHLPPELLPLYGTAAWEAMCDTDRIAYSRHETAALCGAGIWFENVLMQVVLRHLAEMPVTDPAHRYLLVEVADECRHSMMFGEYIRRAGTPAYRPALSPDFLSDDAPGARAVSYLLILAVEELLDYMNRTTMRDERVHATSRAIARLHVLEEARHVSFAKTFLAELLPTMNDADRLVVADAAPVLVEVVADLSVDPAVYEHLGIELGIETARANPFHTATVVAGLTKLTTFLSEIGVIDDEHRSAWGALVA